jgi:hypothetical protein
VWSEAKASKKEQDFGRFDQNRTFYQLLGEFYTLNQKKSKLSVALE